MNKDTQLLDGHIINIIQNHEVREQSDLQDLLLQRSYNIPQATLSRRLKKLKIAKVSGVYTILDYNQPYLPLVLNMKKTDYGFIILHTHPGNANSLAYYFDQKYVNFNPKKDDGPIAGTIAGDDTLVLLTLNKSKMNEAIELIKQDFPYLAS